MGKFLESPLAKLASKFILRRLSPINNCFNEIIIGAALWSYKKATVITNNVVTRKKNVINNPINNEAMRPVSMMSRYIEH